MDRNDALRAGGGGHHRQAQGEVEHVGEHLCQLVKTPDAVWVFAGVDLLEGLPHGGRFSGQSGSPPTVEWAYG